MRTGGDQIYDGAGVTINTGTFDLNGNSETIDSLNGSGGSVTNTGSAAAILAVGSASMAGSGSGTYGGVISDGSTARTALAKNGTGTLTLTGASTYTGGITLNGGTLVIPSIADGGTASPLGASSNNASNLVLNGGTLAYTGSTATTDRGVAINAPGGTLDVTTAGTALTFQGTVTSYGGGLLTVAGPGTLTLAGGADNAGLAVDVTGGTLVLAKASSSSVHAVGGGGITVDGGTVQLAGTGGDQIFDSAPVTVNSGTFDLGGTNETIGGLNGPGGTVTNTNSSAASTLTVTGGGAFAGTFGTSGNGIALTVADPGQTLTLSGNTDNGYLSATVNAGTLILAKTSSSSVHAVGGGLTINGGTAQLAGTGGDQIFDAAGVTVNGGTFDLNGTSETIASLDGTGGTVTNTNASTASTLTVGSRNISGSGTGTYGGVLSDGSGGLALVKNGTGAFILTAVNTFTGGVTLNAGALVLGDGTDAAALSGYSPAENSGASGTVAVTVNGGTLQVQANAIVSGGTGSTNQNTPGGAGGIGVVFAGTATIANAGTINGGAGGGSLNGNGGAGGAGLSSSAGVSLVNGGTISGGHGGLAVEGDGGAGGAGVSFSAGGSLTNSGTINGGGGGSDSNGPNVGSAGMGIVFSGAAGTLENDKGGSINQGVAMDSGYANSVTLQIGSTITGGLNIGTNAGSTLILTDNGTGGSQTYSAAVGGGTTFAGSLIKNGSGTWALDQPLAYSGGTTVSAGTLLAGNTSGSATGTGAVMVNSGGTLGGNGTISGAVTVGSGGTLAPGAQTISRLTLGGTLSLQSGSMLTIALGGTAPGSYDEIQVGGALTLAGTLNVRTVNGFALALGQTFTILENTGATPTIGTFANAVGPLYTDAAGDTFLIDYAAIADSDMIPNDVTLTVFTVVPEPTTWALLLVGAGLWGLRRRRCRP